MPAKYKSQELTTFCKYTDLSTKEIWEILKGETAELERTDLKAIAAELCMRLMHE